MTWICLAVPILSRSSNQKSPSRNLLPQRPHLNLLWRHPLLKNHPFQRPSPATGCPNFFRLTNAAREKSGLAPLSLHSTLCQAADIRVGELPASPSPHLRPDGDAFYTVLADVNLTASYCGENYAIDPTQAASAEQIVNAWLNSPTHRKNILNSSFTGIAFSKAVVNGTTYYEQLFIG